MSPPLQSRGKGEKEIRMSRRDGVSREDGRGKGVQKGKRCETKQVEVHFFTAIERDKRGVVRID